MGTAGDVNHDGFADIIVGAYGSVEASVYHGSPTGPGTEPNWTTRNDQAGSSFGGSVAGAGDVDGDGFSDVIVGVSEYSTGVQYGGRVYLYRGTSDGLETVPAWIGAGDQFNSHYGGKVSTAGDVNGDGASDFMVGQWGYNTAQAGAGRALVYCGNSHREPPVVTIVVTDAVASERTHFLNWRKRPAPKESWTNTATFVVRRSGETNSNLIVFYSIHGTASNGVDYQTLTGTVRIPPGQRSARITVWPIDDKARERLETVVLRLEPDPPPGPKTRYLLGKPAKAAAFILDHAVAIAPQKLSSPSAMQ